MSDALRLGQIETLRFVRGYPDGCGAWELAEFGPGGASIRSGESRLERLCACGYLNRSADKATRYWLTRKALALLDQSEGGEAS